jgi:MFS family permease
VPALPTAGNASAARTVATKILIADRQSSAVRKLLFLTGAVVFVDTLFFAALTPLLPHYAHALGLGKTGAGVLSAAYPAGAFLGAIPSGLVAGRLGVKPTTIVGLTLVGTCTILFGFADHAWQLDLARFAQGLASAFSWTGAIGWLVASAPPGRRGRLIGNAFAAAVGGALFGPVIGGVASVAGTRWTFGAVGLASFGLVAWAALTPGESHEPQSPAHLIRALGDRRILVAGWFVLLPALLFGVVGVLAPLRLSQLGFGAVAIGAVFLCSAGFETVNNVLLGRMSDRRGPLPPIFAGLAASIIVAVLLPWPDNRFVLAVLVVAAGLSFGTFFTPGMTLLSNLAEARGLRIGYASALVNVAWAPGQTLGAAGGGALAHATRDAVPYLSLAAICALTLLVLWRSHASIGLTTPSAPESSSSSSPITDGG